MFRKKECVAMLLAGGKGNRLMTLTDKIAKPAVQFGGKYRIIDFTLSNCINSGFDTVGVLTQYQPLFLNEYIGNGEPWDLDRTSGGVKILPPYQGKNGADWYSGTANAIYQNMEFISRYDPEYVLVLSGDHIYKMDYSEMFRYHKQKNADCTIAVIDVPIEEASRFGIMTLGEDGSIKKFTEKPKNPDSTKASMGIYFFKRDRLSEFLAIDAKDNLSANDFGKNIIPNMLRAGQRMFAYPFSGYWKDVGTITSLWEANMDLLGDNPKFTLGEGNKKIYSRHVSEAPQYIEKDSVIENSMITEGCEVYGTLINSVIGAGVKIMRGARVCDCVIMDGVIVKEGATLDYCVIDSGVSIGKDARVGKPKSDGAEITVVGAGAVIKDCVCVSGEVSANDMEVTA